MFKLYLSGIKTSFILLLFSLAAKSSVAATCENKNEVIYSRISATNFIFSDENHLPQDTIQPGQANDLNSTNQQSKFAVPLPWSDETFEFQVNSEIIYYKFEHFRITESRKLFLQALIKEKELSQLTRLTDSLRQEYILAQDDRKNEISGLILNNEKQSILLNLDIPELFQNARKKEAEYWKNISPEKVAGFQDQIRIYLDSIKRISKMDELKRSVSESKTDTITLYKPKANVKDIQTTATSGIIYKIQIAAFKNKLPDSADKAIKKLSLLRKVETYTDEKGVKVYTTGSLKTWTEAVTLQKQVKQEGIRNPSIAAYDNNIRIPVNEARRKNNEL